MEAPLRDKNYLNSLNSHFNDAVYLTTYKSKTDSWSDMVNLIATKTEFISQVFLLLFQNLQRVSKKRIGFRWLNIYFKNKTIRNLSYGTRCRYDSTSYRSKE